MAGMSNAMAMKKRRARDRVLPEHAVSDALNCGRSRIERVVFFSGLKNRRLDSLPDLRS